MNKTFRYEGRKCHLVHEMVDISGVDDDGEGCDIIVYRWYIKSKKRWKYEVVKKWLYEATKDGWE